MNATRRRGRPVTFDQEIALDAVKGAAGDARAKAIQRAYLLQEEQLQVNAVSEYMNGR